MKLEFTLSQISFLFLIFVISCSSVDKLSKTDYLNTKLIDSGLYLESYRVDTYGVGGDIYSIYISDSLNFRRFITLYYDNERIVHEINADSISISRMEEIGGYAGIKQTLQVLEKFTYLKSELIKDKTME